MTSIDIIFDGPPGPEAGRFVEVERPPGTGISFGAWTKRDDGYWALRFSLADCLPADARTVVAKALLDDLSGRTRWWNVVDRDIQEEIIETLTTKVLKALSEPRP